MAFDASIIKSYLVELGFKTDNHQLFKFKEGLKVAAAAVGESTGKIGKSFLTMGAVGVGALASLAAGIVGLSFHTAKSDLDMQLFARRMFLNTDAARKLKTATDALGYSIEEIIWGPPELAQRYQQLMKDQDKMMKALGGADFETQMRNLRDIRFEFTRLGVELQYFAMIFVKDLSKALFGDENGLLNKLKEFNTWFQDKMPLIADRIATQIAPAFHELGVAAGHLWISLSNVDWATLLVDITKISTALIHMLDYVISHPLLAKALLGGGAGAAIGGSVGGVPGALIGGSIGAIAATASPGGTRPASRMGYGLSDFSEAYLGDSASRWLFGRYYIPRQYGNDAMSAAAAIGAKLGVNPAWIYGQFVHETGGFTNRGATSLNNLAGLRDLKGQYRSFGSINDFADYYAAYIARKFPGAVGASSDAAYFSALKSGGYFEDSYDNYLKGARRGEAQYQPSSINMQGSSVSVTINGNADPADTHRNVKAAVDEANSDLVAKLILMQQGVYAG